MKDTSKAMVIVFYAVTALIILSMLLVGVGIGVNI